MQSKAGEDLFVPQLPPVFLQVAIDWISSWAMVCERGQDRLLGLTYIRRLGPCFCFSTDEILSVPVQAFVLFSVFVGVMAGISPIPSQGCISQPPVRKGIGTCPDVATRRKLNTWMWREKSLCAQWTKQRGKTLNLPGTCLALWIRQRLCYFLVIRSKGWATP